MIGCVGAVISEVYVWSRCLIQNERMAVFVRGSITHASLPGQSLRQRAPHRAAPRRSALRRAAPHRTAPHHPTPSSPFLSDDLGWRMLNGEVRPIEDPKLTKLKLKVENAVDGVADLKG